MIDFTQEELDAEAAGFEGEAPAAEPQQPRDEAGRFAPVQQEEPQPQQTQEHERQQSRTVPHAALHAEREGHKATKAQLQQAQEQLRRINELRAQFAASQSAPPAPLAQAPEPQQAPDAAQQGDPAGLDFLRQRLGQLEQDAQQRQYRETERELGSQEQTVLHNQLVQSEHEFRAATPDYDSAVTHLVNARARQLQMMGLGPIDVQQTLANEVLEITRTAIQQGRAPAELAYDWAQTYGYVPQSGQQQAQQQPNAMLAAIQQGQKQRTLSGARGGASVDQINADALANMSAAEFERLYATPEGKRLIDQLG